MKVVNLVCDGCGKPFDRLKREYDRQIKKGRTKMYCSLSCGSHYGRIDEFSSFKMFLRRAQKISKKYFLPFDLTTELLKKKWNLQQGICPYTKIKMDLSETESKKEFLPQSASLDRIDSLKGYTIDNVEFVCLFINYGKNTFSKESVRQFLNKI